VVIKSSDYEVVSDSFIADIADNRKLKAMGNVKVNSAKWGKLNAASIDIDLENKASDDSSSLMAQNIIITPKPRGRIIAESVVQNGNTREVRGGKFTLCKVPDDQVTNTDYCPLWQLEADKIYEEQEQQNIVYENVFFNFYDVPIFYLPYFYHPTAEVKKRSGFLVPKMRRAEQRGTILHMPYFIDIDTHRDITITPMYTSSIGQGLMAEYRHLFTGDDSLTLEASITNGEKHADTAKNATLSHLFAQGHFNHSDRWKTRVHLQETNNKTYLERFEIDGRDILTSEITSEYYASYNSYASIAAYKFTGLRDFDDDETIPKILPIVNINHYDTDVWGGMLSHSLVSNNLNRVNGEDSILINHLTAWDRKDILGISAISWGAGSYLDLINLVDNGDDNVDKRANRFAPYVYVMGEVPLVKRGQQATYSIIPKAGAFLIHNSRHEENFAQRRANNDSRVTLIDEVGLFSPNLYQGRDRISDGLRFSYGISFDANYVDDTYIGAFIGQSYQNDEDKHQELADQGFAGNYSDIVSNFTYYGKTFFADKAGFNYKARMDNEDFSVNYSDASVFLDNKDYSFALSYIKDDVDNGTEDMVFQASYLYDTNWLFDFEYWYSISDSSSREIDLSFMYYSDCAGIGLEIERDFTNDDATPSETSIGLRLDFSHVFFGQAKVNNVTDSASGGIF
jgi:LPS-assembly protein